MFTAKKKINVREPVQASGFTTTWYQVQNYIQENGKVIAWIAVAVVAIAVFAYVYISNKAQENVEASAELARVATLYEQQQYKLAIDGDRARGIPSLKEVAEKYSGTSGGEQASLLLGNSYLYLGQYDNAISAYEQADPDGDILKSGVQAGLAAAYEGKGNFARAAELFEKSASTFQDDQISADRFVQAARNYARAGEKQKALELYEHVRNDLKAPRYSAREIDRRISELGLD